MLDNSLPASENNCSGVWLADNPTYNQNHAGQICVTASQSLPIHLSLCRTLGWKKTFSEQSKSTKHAWVYTSHIQTHTYTPSLALYADYVCVYLPRTQANIFQWQFDLHLSNGCFFLNFKVTYPFPQRKKTWNVSFTPSIFQKTPHLYSRVNQVGFEPWSKHFHQLFCFHTHSKQQQQ